MARKRKRRTPQQATTNWVNAMMSTQAQSNYKAGTANKGAAAMAGAGGALDEGRYLAGVQRAINNGSMAVALSNPMAANLYNQNTQSKGAANLGPGAQAKQAKYNAAITGLQTVYDQMRQAAAAITGVGPVAAAQRAAAAVQVLASSGKKATGG